MGLSIGLGLCVYIYDGKEKNLGWRGCGVGGDAGGDAPA